MPRYKNLSGDSGVIAYEIAPDSITLTFVNGDEYRYSYIRPGRTTVEHMKTLARRGSDLSTYVSQHVRDNYECKLSGARRRPAAPTRKGTSPPQPPR